MNAPGWLGRSASTRPVGKYGADASGPFNFTTRRVIVFRPSRIARIIGAEKIIGRSRIAVAPWCLLSAKIGVFDPSAGTFADRNGFVRKVVPSACYPFRASLVRWVQVAPRHRL